MHHDKTANIRLALIKCSISDETKLYLSTTIPSEYKWLDIFNTKNIPLAPVDQKIITYLTQGKSIIRSDRKSSGFASMSEEKRKLIASMGGKHAHALGKAHAFSHQQAVRAGILSWQKPNPTKKIDLATTNLKKSQLLTLLQDSLTHRPGKPVSFVALGKELGISRQSVRMLYHRLKSEQHPLPPVSTKTRGFASMTPEKRRMIAGLGGKSAQAGGLSHKWSSEEARRATKIGHRASNRRSQPH